VSTANTRRGIPTKTGVRPCHYCGNPFSVLMMQCPSCLKNNASGPKIINADGNFGCKLLSEIGAARGGRPQDRIRTVLCDKVFGGEPDEPIMTPEGLLLTWKPGLVRTSVVLIGGGEGAGKSTLALQLLDSIAGTERRPALYIGVEETEDEIDDRAVRLQLPHRDLIRLYGIGNEADIGAVIMHFMPCAMVLDSVPGLCGEDLHAAVEMCKTLKLFSAKLKAPCLVIDQVNKDDDFAGLRQLRHTVDTTATFFKVEDAKRPPQMEKVRELCVEKNRNGRANIFSEFEMTERGLVPIPEYEEEEQVGEPEEPEEERESP
jgi:predicted ATP-dependent serine protease